MLGTVAQERGEMLPSIIVMLVKIHAHQMNLFSYVGGLGQWKVVLQEFGLNIIPRYDVIMGKSM